MEDYAGNSKKGKQQAEKKKVEPVVTGEVLVPKKGLGAKLKATFIETDFRSAGLFVIHDVFAPMLRDMIWAGISKGAEKVLFGDRAYRAGIGRSQTTYIPYHQRGAQRPGQALTGVDNLDRRGLTSPGIRNQRNLLNTEIILASQEEADLVLERMMELLQQWQVVSVADLNNLTRQASTYVDEKYGWVDLRGAQITQMREGWLLDLPQPIVL